MTSHFTGTTKTEDGVTENSVFRRLRKTGSEGADVTCSGRPFQIRAAATGKARSPTVDNRVRRTTSDDDEAERRRRRASKSAGLEVLTGLDVEQLR